LSTETHPRPDRPLRGALQSFDLEAEISRLREESEGGATQSPYAREEA
jgi:hypothetical protein